MRRMLHPLVRLAMPVILLGAMVSAPVFAQDAPRCSFQSLLLPEPLAGASLDGQRGLARVIVVNSCAVQAQEVPTFLVTWDDGLSSYVDGSAFALDDRPV